MGIGHRNAISFGAGMTSAYVFVHVMPEMHGAREAFAKSVSIELRYEGMAIYFVGLLGFLVFYGLDHLRQRANATADSEEDRAAFKIHLGGFAAYVGLISYLLVHLLEETPGSIVLYAVAISLHFLTVDHSLREEYGAAYDSAGRYLLASAALLGWGLGQAMALPTHVVAMLVAFISGAIMVNSMISELPADKDGRFVPFMLGGLLYGLILLPLG
jgi:hypothetical protein